MSLNVKLVVVGGDVKTTELTLRLPSTIGRGRGTSVILPHPLVSRQHCELYEADGQLMVRDLGSLNGTFVNNQRITESLLAPGELLTVGTVTFRAVYEFESELPPTQANKLKRPGDEKTLNASKAAASAAPKRPAQQPAQPAASDSAPLEFDFGKPLFDEEPSGPAPGGPAHVTERLDAGSSVDKSSKSGGKKAGQPAQPSSKKPPPAQKPPAQKPSANKGKPKDSDDESAEKKPPSSSDDDLNDFLESLGE